MATLDGARASPFGDETLAARAEEAFDALRSAAPVCRRRRGIALYGIARALDLDPIRRTDLYEIFA